MQSFFEREKERDSRLKHHKLNRELYALSCGRQHQPPMAKKLSQKRKRMKYRQYRRQLKDESYMTLYSMHLEEIIPTINEILDSPISNYISLAKNDCGYSGTAEELIVNYVHRLFLKEKATASSGNNLNWRQAMNGQFADEY